MSYMCGYNDIKEITTESLLKRYRLIGFTETFKKSMTNLKDILSSYKKVNVLTKGAHVRRNKKKPKLKLSPEFIELFKENNKLDYKLYETAKHTKFS